MGLLYASILMRVTLVSIELDYLKNIIMLTHSIDIVGNNIPVFFIQDAIKFPDLIHAVKPKPDSEIPQAATAHDSAWDFFSQQPSSMHTLLWAMSGHGTLQGKASLLWEEAQMAAGMNADLHRQDLFDSIDKGYFPEWVVSDYTICSKAMIAD
jgi:catalase